jgi:GH18 family chitinase
MFFEIFPGWWGVDENGDDLHNFTGHNAPLHGRVEELPEDHPGWLFNAYDTINVYLDMGAPANKIVMGMPAYGRGFLLDDNERNGLYCPAHDGVPKLPYTRQIGIWGYQEILQAFNNDTMPLLPEATPKGWEIVRDDCYNAPYTCKLK